MKLVLISSCRTKKSYMGPTLFIAALLSSAMIVSDFSAPSDASENDMCAVYLVQIILDTAFGIVIM